VNIYDQATVTVSYSGIELIALKKLSLVSHALAQKIGGSAGEEQTTLARTLDDVIRRLELAAVPSKERGEK